MESLPEWHVMIRQVTEHGQTVINAQNERLIQSYMLTRNYSYRWEMRIWMPNLTNKMYPFWITSRNRNFWYFLPDILRGHTITRFVYFHDIIIVAPSSVISIFGYFGSPIVHYFNIYSTFSFEKSSETNSLIMFPNQIS